MLDYLIVERNKKCSKMERSHIPKYVMNTLCRICAEKTSKLTSIFECESLPLKIYKCLPIRVKESDFLPLKVCDSCYLKINETYSFYRKANEADRKLKKLWKILVRETTASSSEGFLNEKNTVALLNNPLSFLSIQDTQSDISASDLFFNFPEEVTYHAVEILGDESQLMNGLVNNLVIARAISLEVMNESLTLENYEKTSDETLLNESSDLMEKTSVNEHGSPKITKLYQCKFCSYQTSSLSAFTSHQGTHSEERPYLCDTCGKSFKHAKYLRSHAKTHSSVRKKYNCKLCTKGFLTNFFLQEHMNTHTGETPYTCQVCGKKFREKVHLRQHKWTHSRQKFACPICNSTFNRKGNMNEHMKQFHKNEVVGKPKISQKKTEEDPNPTFKCPACNSVFQNQLLLNNHLKIHPEQKRFSCALCGKKFRHSGSLTYHRRTAHTGERPFQCKYCDQKFSLKSVQVIHERKYHTFDYPYKCQFCSRPFTNSSSLGNHMYVHSKDKMFKCEECGKKFARRSNLFIHKKLHSGDRKFTCDQCGKNYVQKHDLQKHRKVHDPKSKPFFCKYCGNSFSHKKDSAKHAMCQFDFVRKNNSVIYSAEKILDSVTNSLERDGGEFSAEEEQQLFLESVEEFSGEKVDIIYSVEDINTT